MTLARRTFRTIRSAVVRSCHWSRTRWNSLQTCLRPSSESAQASKYWAGLTDYDNYYHDQLGLARSRWLAHELLPSLGVTSVLEVGTNSGRNLAVLKAAHPEIKLRGIDVNAAAISYARTNNPDIEFAVADANQ